ncbi:helix-turn-helix transcriptional regulator [Streptomyces lancefieldiae]|uniref:Transcriptional regulator n=1 Tax=Streptomyces lancefieldiae TaxID=3075520 RepID=A0ABU3AZG3_9ACTN|nr:transcriptional regulator [Streptomyces sp. DSM 40712]MDT0614473.1 transcriptional regulator [Streptomyces sp. DSM 40712]
MRPRDRARQARNLCHLLIRARLARGWNQPEMARRIRNRSQEMGWPLLTGRDGVCHWERGREPDRPTQLVIAAVLGIPPEAVDERPWPQWLAEDPLQRPEPRPWTRLGALTSLTELAGSAAVDTTRRELILIAGGTLTATLLAWITADPVAAGQMATGERIGEAAVARVEARAAALRHTDDAEGGAEILDETSSALALVAGLLSNRSYKDHHGTRLYAVASDLARQRAAAMLDVYGDCSDTTFDTALRAARIAGDDALGANVLNFWTVSAYNTGRYADAEDMASTGLAAVRGRSTPRVEAMLTSRRGRARAHLGDARCWDDFDRAEALLAEASGHDDPDWAYWFDEAEVLGARASSHRDMGQPGPAAAGFARVHDLIDPAHVRTTALYTARQADALLDQGQVERACAVADHALDLTEAISSHRSTAPLLDLTERLKRYEGTPAARDFRERAHAVLAA